MRRPPLHPVRLAGLLLGLALLAGQPAFAQADTPEARRAVAQSLVKALDELSGPERSMRAVGATMRQAMQQQVAANPKLTPAQQQRAADVMSQEVMAALTETLKESMPALYTAMEDLYVQRFSLAELRELERFYTSATGRKSVSVMMDDMPALMQPMMRTMQGRAPMMQQRMEAAVERLRAEGIELQTGKP